MENISFVLWVCLWPLCVSVGNFIDAKKRKITGEEEPSSDSKLLSVIIFIAIWIAVAKSL